MKNIIIFIKVTYLIKDYSLVKTMAKASIIHLKISTLLSNYAVEIQGWCLPSQLENPQS